MTDKQRETLVFIMSYQSEHGYPPSRIDLAKHFNIAVNAIVGRLSGLERKGHIAIDKGVSRGIRIL